MFSNVELPFTVADLIIAVMGFIGTLDRLILLVIAVSLMPAIIFVIYKTVAKKN